MKPKLLCILHRAPPAHGAAKVGDFIASSRLLEENFELLFITIKSSETIGDIGKINFKKIYYVLELYFKILIALITFQPDKIYFTASIRGVAFYRDLLISSLWKIYKLFKPVEIFYHYHTKGVKGFVSSSKRNLKLTRFFIKNTNLILLSPLLESDFEKVQTYKEIKFLPNGVEDRLEKTDFESYVVQKYKQVDTLNVLYLAHMMRDKGYFDALKLAKQTKNKNIHYHFAGSWKDKESEVKFFKFIKKHELDKQVIYHGYVSGNEKATLFKSAHLLLYPSKNDAFPLTLLESLSYGVPVLATDEGSIPYILDEKSGIVLDDVQKLPDALKAVKYKFVNIDTAKYSRTRFLEYFTQAKFETNIVNILKD